MRELQDGDGRGWWRVEKTVSKTRVGIHPISYYLLNIFIIINFDPTL